VSGTFAEKASMIAASERLYRVGLFVVVIGFLNAVLLYFALHVTLKRVNNFLGQLAMIFGLLDAGLAAWYRCAVS